MLNIIYDTLYKKKYDILYIKNNVLNIRFYIVCQTLQIKNHILYIKYDISYIKYNKYIYYI